MTIRPDDTTAAELRSRSLTLLEFPRVREALAAHARLPISREMALALEPLHDPDAVRQRQQETAEARLLFEQGDVDLGMERDVRSVLRRAAAQAVLTGEELVTVADTLDHLRRAKLAGGRLQGATPHLRSLTRNIPDLRALERDIRDRLMPSGEVVDDATPYLRQLRHEGRAAYRRATEALEQLMAGDAVSEALQDRRITVRSERLVVAVKADFRGRLGGIVHDVSDSGATLFVEPFGTVGLTNAWRESTAAEQEEVRRILRQLSQAVSRRVSDISYALELAGRLDLALAKARYARALRAEPATVVPAGVRLVNARHPLLTGPVVPLSLTIEPPLTGVVVTGPNTGGKTVALKTLGLMLVMNQCGMHVPCDASTRLPIVDGVYADIGDQQSIEQSISTFSSHMTNIAAVLAHVTARSVALFDELGTGTDPDEGSALARAILAHLAAREVTTLVTTHHRSVAAFAEEQPSLQNASVELDPVTLRPTYRLVQGLPGRSYALAVAERIGLDARVVEAARALQDPAHRTAEALLASIQEERHHTRQRLEEAERAKERAEALERELEQRLDELARARARVVDQTRHELQAQAREVLDKLKQAEASAVWDSRHEGVPPPRVIESAREEIAEAQRMLRSRVWGQPAPGAPAPASRRAAIAEGDTVEIGSLGFTGQVLSGPDADKRVEVRIGSARLWMDASRLRRVDAPLADTAARPHTSIRLSPERQAIGAEPEVDLRGMRAADALEKLDDHLDAALAQGRPGVRVVHGKGTGALRRAVWEHLAGHNGVARFDFAPPNRGGDGATEVELK